jgi:hypothetical protein
MPINSFLDLGIERKEVCLVKEIRFQIFRTKIQVLILFMSTSLVFGSNSGNSSELINVGRDKIGEIFLEGPSCEDLNIQEQALRDWTEILGEVSGPKASPVDFVEESRCTLNINSSVPKLVRILQDFKTAFNGPNCWNTTLRLSGLIEAQRFSGPEEMSFWLNSRFCRELADNEKSLPGDIVEIRALQADSSSGFEEIHGMIYLTDQMVFSKNTSSRMSPYGIQRAGLVYQTFRVELNCQKVSGSPQGCPRWANHYRCKSSEVRRNSFARENPQFAEISKQLDKIESEISQYVMTGQGSYQADKEVLQKQLLQYKNQIPKFQKPSIDEGFFYQTLILKVESLQSQIGIINKQNAR